MSPTCGRWSGPNAVNSRYHVLGGTLSPLDGVGPQDLTIDALISRVHAEEVKEVILALNATVDGQTTAHYITELLQDANVKVTRLRMACRLAANWIISTRARLSAANQTEDIVLMRVLLPRDRSRARRGLRGARIVERIAKKTPKETLKRATPSAASCAFFRHQHPNGTWINVYHSRRITRASLPQPTILRSQNPAENLPYDRP